MPEWLIALILISAIIFLVLGPYAVARFFLHKHTKQETETLSSSIIFRTASLHGLILALVFAQEQANVTDLRQTTSREASAVADVFYDLERFGSIDSTFPLRQSIAHYLHTVIYEEWDSLSSGNLSSRAWEYWETVYLGILNLTPETIRQESLRNQMLEDIRIISRCRNKRNADSSSGVSSLFWFVAILGVVFVVIPYFVFPARKINLLLIGSFAAYNGIVIYTIYAMSNPFSMPGRVQPAPFIEKFQNEMSAMLQAEKNEKILSE
jgi:hypothetical protein